MVALIIKFKNTGRKAFEQNTELSIRHVKVDMPVEPPNKLLRKQFHRWIWNRSQSCVWIQPVGRESFFFNADDLEISNSGKRAKDPMSEVEAESCK